MTPEEIKIYWAKRWRSFKPEEVLSTEQVQLLYKKGVMSYSFRALDKLQKFRDLLDVPLVVNIGQQQMRGARSIREVYHVNKNTRPAGQEWGYSFHLWCAFDVYSPQLKPMEIFERAVRSGLWKGIGIYQTFVHLDDRDSFSDIPTTWDYTHGGQ